MRDADASTWAAVLWQSIGNTLFGFAAWGWLLARHPAATIAPLALLVPVFGIAASHVCFGEPLPAWKLIAATHGDGRTGAQPVVADAKASAQCAARSPQQLA